MHSMRHNVESTLTSRLRKQLLNIGHEKLIRPWKVMDFE